MLLESLPIQVQREKNINPFYDNSNEDNNSERRMRIQQEYSMHYNDTKKKKTVEEMKLIYMQMENEQPTARRV